MEDNSDSFSKNAGLRRVLGPYRLVGEIGRGGMAEVLLAVFPNGDGTGRTAALKRLHPDLALDRDFRAMFEDEARLATRLHHANVVETYDIYSDPELCVLLMEFLEGQSLSRVRQTAHRMGGLPLPLQLHCMAQVLAGLDYVHELTDGKGNPLRIVHRDVTPSNVFLTYRGEVKVVDFGIARASTRLAETRAGVLKGKLVYMSPEAVRGEPVDRRSDIFSVGVMLWEAVTGRRLWQDHDELTVFRRLAEGQIPLCPPGFGICDPAALAIAERALSTDPDRRYATAAEMRHDIEGLFAHRGTALGTSALSGYMQSCFADERQKLRATIDEALGRFRQPAPHARQGSNLTQTAPALDASEPPTTASISPAPIVRTLTYARTQQSEPRSAGLPWLGIVCAAGAVALAVSAAFIAHAPHAARAEPSVAPLTSAAVAATAGAAPTSDVVIADSRGRAPASLPGEPVAAPIIDADLEIPPANVTLIFSARPPEARFLLDGERLEGNPVTLRRPPDDKRHRLRIEAPGFVPFSRSFDLDADMTRVFDLVRRPPSPPAAARMTGPAESSAAAKSECPRSRQQAEASKEP